MPRRHTCASVESCIGFPFPFGVYTHVPTTQRAVNMAASDFCEESTIIRPFGTKPSLIRAFLQVDVVMLGHTADSSAVDR